MLFILRSYLADIANRHAKDTWIRKLVVTKESKLYGKVLFLTYMYIVYCTVGWNDFEK